MRAGATCSEITPLQATDESTGNSGLLRQVREEAVEVIVTAIDKHIADMSKCSKVRISDVCSANFHYCSKP